jgi:hypothetical protein
VKADDTTGVKRRWKTGTRSTHNGVRSIGAVLESTSTLAESGAAAWKLKQPTMGMGEDGAALVGEFILFVLTLEAAMAPMKKPMKNSRTTTAAAALSR